MADYLTQRVWIWDGEVPSASRWQLLGRREIDETKLKFGLSNAKASASLHRLTETQGARHFVEPSFRAAKAPAAWPSIRSAAGRRGTITWPWS